MNEVRSLHRRVRLATPPAEPWQIQVLSVPVGATDRQVLGWAAEVLDERSLAELRQIIERDAAATADAGGGSAPA